MTDEPTIVVALLRRADELLLVQAQGPDDPVPIWMLPGGKVEDGEGILDALRRELIEETGLRLTREPRLVFTVEVDYQAETGTGRYRALTYDCRASGELRPGDPDGLVTGAAWLGTDEALGRLSKLQWYESEPLRRFLTGEALAGAAYRYRVTGKGASMVRDRLEVVGED